MIKRARMFPNADSILDVNHWTCNPKYPHHQRITREELRVLLLNDKDKIIRRGVLAEMKKTFKAAGVYDIWFEDAP